MAWWAALLTAALVVVVFWVPGTVVARAWGEPVSALARLAVAPALTIGVLAPGAVVLGGRLPWGAPVAALVTAVVAGGGVLVRRGLRSRSPGGAARPTASASPGPRPRTLATAVAAGAALQLVPVAIAMRRPDAHLAAHDVPFHLAALAHVRMTGDGSTLSLMASAQVHGRVSGGFYAAGWHDAVALVPRWPDASAVATAGALVPTALAWSLGLAYLTSAVLPSRPRTWVLAPLLGSAGIASPLLLVMRPEGMVPNALALGLLPAVVAVVLHVARRPTGPGLAVAAVAVSGLALSHPNGVATALVATLPAVVVAAVTHRVRVRRARLIAVALPLVVLVAAGALLVLRSPQLAFVTTLPPEPPIGFAQAVVTLASGNGTGLGWSGGQVVMLLGVAGATVARRLPARHLVRGWLALCALYLASTSAVPWLTDVDRLWYGEVRRFAPAVGALAVPFAALALEALWRRVRREDTRMRRTVSSLLVVAVALPAVLTAAGVHDLARASFVPAPGRPALADAAELDMARRLEGVLDRDRAVLGSPFAGTSNLTDRFGQPVVPPSNVPTLDPDVDFVWTHLGSLTADPAVCAAVDRLGIGYVYVDPEPWNVVEGVPDVRTAPRQGVRLVDSGGSAAVYEITAC